MQERVQLNVSVSREQKLALQALAEGHETTVTALILGLLESTPSAALRVPVVAPMADSKPEARPGEGGSHTPNPADPSSRRGGSAGASKPCRHGIPNCRVCQTGVYA